MRTYHAVCETGQLGTKCGLSMMHCTELKQDGKAVIMAEAACMATLTDLMVTSDQATNSSIPAIQFNSFLILI